mgnify:CR=1 FL=1
MIVREDRQIEALRSSGHVPRVEPRLWNFWQGASERTSLSFVLHCYHAPHALGMPQLPLTHSEAAG